MNKTTLPFTGEFTTPGDFSLQCNEVLAAFTESNNFLQNGRNKLKVINFEDKLCVVKAFRVPSFPQNFGYGLFSDSKANKSFNNALNLIDTGFNSPSPIGYFEHRQSGKLKTSYYVSIYEKDSVTLDSLWCDELLEEDSFNRQFAQYCSNLHSTGVLHRDFNPKNILISGDSSRDFSLVDINRITWYKKLSLYKAMKSLSRLPFKASQRDVFLDIYAQCAGVSIQKCKKMLDKAEYRTQLYFRNKRRLRKIFPKK